jgi:hypothetical protein
LAGGRFSRIMYRIGMESAMRKPSPQALSLSLNPIFSEYPYNQWIKYCINTQELKELAELFQSLPIFWIKSIEQKVNQMVKRNFTISKPLYYRISLLWSSILVLQESKFICDNVENSLRQVFISHLMRYKIKYFELEKFVPNYDAIKGKYEKNTRESIDENLEVEPNFIISFSSYELTESICRKWTKLNGNTVGFGMYFKHYKRCRDRNVFRRDMKCIRIVRNGISHSNRLFTHEEIQKIYFLADKWLQPLSVNLDKKISSYRKLRPHFLDDIELHKQIGNT